MIQGIDRKNSIYVQLLRLLIVAAFAAAFVFWILDSIGFALLDQFLYTSNYHDRLDQKYINELQKYVEKENLSTTDTEEINQWVREQKVVSIYIYKDGIQIFNSDYPEEDVWYEEITVSDYETYYDVDFADGSAQISIVGFYGYQFYNYAMIANIIISFIIFLSLVLLGIRKKMRYITRLSEEIEILEGGSLHYPITVQGKDELAALAAGIDNMRLSFLEMRERESRIVKENQKIVTEMSHDLRTPVTSILLYAEILKKEKEGDIAKRRKYLETIERKARRMKQLTDHLFEYSLVTREDEIQLGKPETMQVLFYDLFSETCMYLEQKGFSVDFRVKWTEEKIQISEDYMMRIMDNITSNLIKYADPAFPISIVSATMSDKEVYMEENASIIGKNKHIRSAFTGFQLENHVQSLADKSESTGIGIQSVKNMMRKMNGICIVKQEQSVFWLTILFPCV